MVRYLTAFWRPFNATTSSSLSVPATTSLNMCWSEAVLATQSEIDVSHDTDSTLTSEAGWATAPKQAKNSRM